MNKKLEKIFKDIETHNQKIFDNTKSTEKIDFSKTKKNWGSDVIPKEFWIDLTKEYKTIQGNKVILHEIKMKTFPIKGIIYKKRIGKKTLPIFMIWTLDGRSMVNGIDNHKLVLVKN